MPQIFVAAVQYLQMFFWQVGFHYTTAAFLGKLAAGLLFAGAIGKLTKPKAPVFSQQDNKTAVRSAVAPRRVIYGRDRVSGPVVFVDSTGDDNKYLHVVIAFAGHECEEIETVYFNDEPINVSTELDVDGNVNAGKFKDKARIKLYLGTTTQTADADLIAEAGNYVNNDVSIPTNATSMIKLKEITATKTETAAIQYYVNDYYENDGGGAQYVTEYQLYLNGSPVAGTLYTSAFGAPLGGGLGYVLEQYNVAVTQGDLIQVYGRLVDQGSSTSFYRDLYIKGLSIVQTAWTSAHRLRGVCYGYFRLEFDPDVFENGVPAISALIKGKKVFDPRTSTTAWSDNWALCIRDYLTSDYGLGYTASEIDDASFITAANICEESVDVPDGAGGTTTQDRYPCNGSFTLDRTPLDIIENMLLAGAGVLTWTQGKYVLYAGKYTASVKTLTENDLAGPVEVQADIPRKEVYNGVRGTFIDPLHDYNVTDFPPYINNTFVTEDNGENIYKDFDLEFVKDAYHAQRLAKLSLYRSREPIVVKFPVKYTAIDLAIWDTVQLDFDQCGWSGKTFKVVDIVLNSDFSLSVTCQEEESTSYAWADTDATEVTVSPDTNLKPSTIQAPSALTLSAVYTVLADGTVDSAIQVNWASPPSTLFLNGYGIRWKKTSDSIWTNGYVVASETDLLIKGLEADDYEVQIRSHSYFLNGFSDWVSTTSPNKGYITLTGKVTGPSAPTSGTLTEMIQAIGLSWTNPVDPDLKHIEIYESTSNNRATAVEVGVSYTDYAVIPRNNGTTYYYWLRAVDTSFNTSNWYPNTTTTILTGEAQQVAGGDIADASVDFLTKVTGSEKPANNATVGATIGTDLGGQFNSGNESTFFAAGAISANSINVVNLAALNAAMGNLTSGTITLDATGHIKGGQTAYNSGIGYWLGYSGSDYYFSIGDSTGDRFTFDGGTGTVTVVGNFSIQNASGVRTDLNVADGADVTVDALIAGAVITNGGITLNSGGAITSNGSGGYDANSGVYFGWDSGEADYVLSIKNTTTGNKLTWDGDNLTILGGIDLGDGVTSEGYIHGDAATFLSPGFFLGWASGNLKFSVGAGSTSYRISYDSSGPSLIIKPSSLLIEAGCTVTNYEGNQAWTSSLTSDALSYIGNSGVATESLNIEIYDGDFRLNDSSLTANAMFFDGSADTLTIYGDVYTRQYASGNYLIMTNLAEESGTNSVWVAGTGAVKLKFRDIGTISVTYDLWYDLTGGDSQSYIITGGGEGTQVLYTASGSGSTGWLTRTDTFDVSDLSEDMFMSGVTGNGTSSWKFRNVHFKVNPATSRVRNSVDDKTSLLYAGEVKSQGISNGAAFTPSTLGMYQIASTKFLYTAGTTQSPTGSQIGVTFQIKDEGGTWRGDASGTIGGIVHCDGVHHRIYNGQGSVSTIYYQECGG